MIPTGVSCCIYYSSSQSTEIFGIIIPCKISYLLRYALCCVIPAYQLFPSVCSPRCKNSCYNEIQTSGAEVQFSTMIFMTQEFISFASDFIFKGDS